jgi:subtilisin family serine protease
MARLRIAAIDSGVNAHHPHVQPIAGGVRITAEGEDQEYIDVLWHGTAVVGAIREKAPGAEIYAVKVFERSLVTSGAILLRAIDWCLEHEMQFINLSLGTTNEAYRAAFLERIGRANEGGIQIVAAFEMNGQPALPGSLSGVAGVLMNPACPRERYWLEERQGQGQRLYTASPYARPIPGVPLDRNLHGISFAVANVTGLLASESEWFEGWRFMVAVWRPLVANTCYTAVE